MRFDWYQYLIAAWETMGRRGQRANREAKQRIAISRAYYAAYIIARNYLRDIENVSIPRHDAHQFVIEHFRASHDPRRKEIARLLRFMRNARTRADYDDIYLLVRRDVQSVPRYAEEVIRLIAGL